MRGCTAQGIRKIRLRYLIVASWACASQHTLIRNHFVLYCARAPACVSPPTQTTFLPFSTSPVMLRTPYKRLRTGVCSSWLASLAPGVAEVSPQHGNPVCNHSVGILLGLFVAFFSFSDIFLLIYYLQRRFHLTPYHHTCCQFQAFQPHIHVPRNLTRSIVTHGMTLKPEQVPLSIRRGTFKLPESPHHPLIMVGPGTGVSPMRGVILERRRQRETLTKNTGTGYRVRTDKGDGVLSPPREGREARGGAAAVTAPDTLFFGCRYVCV